MPTNTPDLPPIITPLGQSPVITIDGPEASGKGTLARELAAHFNFYHLDTGAIYRCVAHAVLAAGADPENAEQSAIAAKNLATHFDITLLQNPDIRTPAVGQAASKASAHPAVREALLNIQRQIAHNPPAPYKGSVLDGRDTGTVVCPDATLKIYLTADAQVRAKRRFDEFTAKGQTVTYESVLNALKERDARDTSRKIAPLKPAPDAFILDTTDTDAQGALKSAIFIVKQKLAAKPN